MQPRDAASLVDILEAESEPMTEPSGRRSRAVNQPRNLRQPVFLLIGLALIGAILLGVRYLGWTW